MPSGHGPSFPGISEARFKRSLLGYRRADVDAAIASGEAALAEAKAELESASEALDAERRRATSQSEELRSLAMDVAARSERIDDLERVSNRLAEGIVERERELSRLRDELAAASERSEASLRALASLADELEGVRRQARGQATRIRMSALREAADVSRRIAELARHPGEVGAEMIESVQEAIRRIGGDESAAFATADGAAEPAARGEPDPASSNGHRPGRADVFEGLVEVEVGPLGDFAQLVGFEDAARSIAATSEISITRFSEGRATIAMTLDEPVALLEELERGCDLELRVRDTRAGRLVLDVRE